MLERRLDEAREQETKRTDWDLPPQADVRQRRPTSREHPTISGAIPDDRFSMLSSFFPRTGSAKPVLMDMAAFQRKALCFGSFCSHSGGDDSRTKLFSRQAVLDARRLEATIVR